MRKNTCIFMDLDGTCISHYGDLFDIMKNESHVLPGVVAFFREARKDGVYIVVTTARPPSLRDFTLRQMEEFGLWCDQLVMGLPTGKRVVINDDSGGECRAIGIGVTRNEGLENITMCNELKDGEE
jgi:hypothetical protein